MGIDNIAKRLISLNLKGLDWLDSTSVQWLAWKSGKVEDWLLVVV
jgi:hypothetical protein